MQASRIFLSPAPLVRRWMVTRATVIQLTFAIGRLACACRICNRYDLINLIDWQLDFQSMNKMSLTAVFVVFDIISEWIAGPPLMRFSITSPDLVVCVSSPDVPCSTYTDSPEIINKSSQKLDCSVELSLDACVNTSKSKVKNGNAAVRFSTACQTFSRLASPESSFELPPPPMRDDDEMKDVLCQSATGSICNSAVDVGVADGLAGVDNPEVIFFM